MTRVALVGLGEVGRVLAEDFRSAGIHEVSVWDTAFGDPQSRASRNAAELGLTPSASAPSAVARAEPTRTDRGHQGRLDVPPPAGADGQCRCVLVAG